MSEAQEKIQYFRTILLKVNRIFSWVYDEEFSLIESNCTWEMILKNFFLLDSREWLDRIRTESGTLPFYFTDGLSFSWIVIPFEHSFFVLGPTFSTDVSEQYFRKQMEIREMSVSSRIKFLKLMKAIPVVPLTTFGQLARMFYYACYDRNIYFSSFQKLRPSDFPAEEPFQAQDIPSSHGTYVLEQRFLSHVENGNIYYNDEIDHFYVQNSDNHVTGALCPGDPLRQAKDEAIVATTLVTRAAIRGGMIPEAAYSLSDYYIQAVENGTDIHEVQDIHQNMFRDFIARVHKIREAPKLSLPIQSCQAYIQQHLGEKLSMELLSRVSGYTPHYLAARFKEETCQSVKHYITEQKLEAARLLLKNSSLDIAEISERLNFTNPSYFSAIFKKRTGCTPSEYREAEDRH